jgi:hypothetical protein
MHTNPSLNPNLNLNLWNPKNPLNPRLLIPNLMAFSTPKLILFGVRNE